MESTTLLAEAVKRKGSTIADQPKVQQTVRLYIHSGIFHCHLDFYRDLAFL